MYKLHAILFMKFIFLSADRGLSGERIPFFPKPTSVLLMAPAPFMNAG
jgi:hypothetical protein